MSSEIDNHEEQYADWKAEEPSKTILKRDHSLSQETKDKAKKILRIAVAALSLSGFEAALAQTHQHPGKEPGHEHKSPVSKLVKTRVIKPAAAEKKTPSETKKMETPKEVTTETQINNGDVQILTDELKKIEEQPNSITEISDMKVDTALKRSIEQAMQESKFDALVLEEEQYKLPELPQTHEHDHEHSPTSGHSHGDSAWIRAHVDPREGFKIKLDELAGFHATIDAKVAGSITIEAEKLGSEQSAEVGFHPKGAKIIGLKLQPGMKVGFSEEGKPGTAFTFTVLKDKLHAEVGVKLGRSQAEHGGHEATESSPEEKDHKNRWSFEAGGKLGKKFELQGGIEGDEIKVIPRFTFVKTDKSTVTLEGLASFGSDKRAGLLLRIIRK